MIIRRDGDALLFVTQPDHAAVSAALMREWRADGLPDHPRRASILLATQEHDNGWREEDDLTHVDEAGRPLDFTGVPAAVKQRIWPRAVVRLAAADAYAAALVARHALTLFAGQIADAAWRRFLARMERLESECLARTPGVSRTGVDDDYRFLQTGDHLSLAFCNGWTSPVLGPLGRAILSGRTLTLTPDPFAGARIPLKVGARRLLARSFGTAAELRDALSAAPRVSLEGDAAGVRPQDT